MSPISIEIKERLLQFSEAYSALKDHALKHLVYCSAIDVDNELLIGHMPWVAPLAYAITIFPPAKKTWLSSFKDKTRKPIPRVYRDFLLTANGCFAYDLSLFGLAPSMQKSPPLLNREKLECHDLRLANEAKGWISEYRVEAQMFHFGSRAFSEDENVGYFLGADDLIRGLRTNGEVVGKWSSFAKFLFDELQVAERMMLKESKSSWWH